MDRRRLRSAHDVERYGLVGVASGTTDFQIDVPGIERVTERPRVAGETIGFPARFGGRVPPLCGPLCHIACRAFWCPSHAMKARHRATCKLSIGWRFGAKAGQGRNRRGQSGLCSPSAIMQNLYGQAKDAAKDAADSATGYARQAMDTGNDSTEALAEMLRDNPIRSLWIAAGVGIAAALLLARPRR